MGRQLPSGKTQDNRQNNAIAASNQFETEIFRNIDKMKMVAPASDPSRDRILTALFEDDQDCAVAPDTEAAMTRLVTDGENGHYNR